MTVGLVLLLFAGLTIRDSLCQYTNSSFPSLPSPIISGYKTTDLDSLWESVEQISPVVEANVTTVLSPIKNFTVGPNPPRFRPAYLKATTDDLILPKGFKYGVATAATQVEGAVKADGRGPTNWDWACHNQPSLCNNQTADVTINEYYLYRRDIQRVKAMGVNTFSLSVAWTRIFPFGKRGSPLNEAGLQFYDDFINELISNDIEPVLTLFHWDTPLNLLVDYGAFLNGSIVDDFTNYAATVFRRYGDRVKTWITFNEPHVYCPQYSSFPYNLTYTGNLNSTTAPYSCIYNLLKAHGSAVHAYRDIVSKNNGKLLKGEISLKQDSNKPLPFDPDSEEDKEAVQRFLDIYLGIFSQPIFGDGNYPQTVLDTIPASILPRLTKEDQELVKGTGDFFAIDGYSTWAAKAPSNGIAACAANISDPNWPICQDFSTLQAQYTLNTGWAIGAASDPLSAWDSDAATHLRSQLKYFNDTYPTIGGIYLSEFGMAEPYEYLRTELYQLTWDERRANYLLDYLNEALLAIHEDGILLKGTFIWTPADNFEWNLALQGRFGLQYVNHSTPELDRTYKLSFFQVRDFFQQHLAH